jgi:hypothetical protein
MLRTALRSGLTFTTILALMFASVMALGALEPQRIYAQQFGATTPPGFFAQGTNAVAAVPVGNGLAVTNPASNFLMLVQGGNIYFNGSNQLVGQSTIQLQASNTYLIVWNGTSEVLYAKTAVTLPGGQSGTTAPGTPGTFLAPIAGVEVPISLVVCNATACGNGGNGTITDQRPVSAFPGAGIAMNTLAFANLPTSNVTNGTIVYCDNCTVASAPCTGASTGALAIRVNGTWRCQ